MSKLIFYFFTIISFVIISNLVSGAPEQKIDTRTSTPIHQSETEDDEEFNDIFYNDPIDIKNSVVIMPKSNGVRPTSIGFLLIGFICLI
jgi:hypothetical protein